MLLSHSQQKRFWREWHAACVAQGWTPDHTWTKAQTEVERYSLLERAGFDSLKDVDPLKGFDKVLEQLAILRSDLSATVRASDMPRTRLEHAIKALAPSEAYWQSIARDRFKTTILADLSIEQLQQLRYTLANRRNPPIRQTRPTSPTRPTENEPF